MLIKLLIKTNDLFKMKTINYKMIRMIDWNSLQNPALAYKGNWNICAYIYLGRGRNASSVKIRSSYKEESKLSDKMH